MFTLSTVLAVTCVPALPAQDTGVDLTTKLVGRPLMLRGMWAEDKLQFKSDGTPQKAYPVEPFTLCGIDVTRVVAGSSQISIEGQRVSLEFDHDGTITRLPQTVGKPHDHKPEKITIEIERDNGSDLSVAVDHVFAASLAPLVPDMPVYWQGYAKTHFLGTAETAAPPKALNKNNASVSEDDRDAPAVKRPMHIGGGVKPPRILKQMDAEFSEAARRAKVSGNVQIYLQVDENGLPMNPRVVRPVGLGLDEKAIEAVSQYTFQPATLSDKPVKVDLYIEVNFQIF